MLLSTMAAPICIPDNSEKGIPLLGILARTCCSYTNSKEHKHPYVHCSIIYNCQDMEAAQVSINR